MITKKIRAIFPGISACIRALKRAWNAYKAYNKVVKAINAVVFAEPINEWAYNVSKRTRLSYEEAQTIYTVITEETDLCKSMQNSITKFVIEMTNCGHTADMIILYLQQMDRELNQ